MNTAEKIRANHLDSPIRSKAVPEAPMADEISPKLDENRCHSSTKPVSARLERIDKYLANAPKWRYALFFFKAADLVKGKHISQVTRLTLATWLYRHTEKTLDCNGIEQNGYDLEEAYRELCDQWTWEGNTKCHFYLEWAEGFKEHHKYYCHNIHGYEFDWWFYEEYICTVNNLYDRWQYGIDGH